MKNYTCSKDLYIKFLKTTSVRYSALALSEVSPVDISHDAISDWLASTKCQPKDIWDKAKGFVSKTPGILVADETVISKNRSQNIEAVSWIYSGNEHDIVKGIGVLNFLWDSTINQGETIPFDYRIYQPPQDGKTKNDHFREMLANTKSRELYPEAIVADSWYSSLGNLKCIRNYGWTWVMGLRKNRVVNKGERLENVTIPKEGLRLHLRGYGWIHVFKFVGKNNRIDYIGTNIETPTEKDVKKFVRMRWDIEIFHRELKQTCGLENCQARSSRSQRNHIGLSILCWIEQAKLRAKTGISLYQLGWDVIKPAISDRLRIEMAFA